MIIALFPNMTKVQSKKIALEVGKYLTSKNIKVLIEDDEATELGAFPLSKTPPETIDFMISMGGDGTILRVLHRHPEITAPLLAINVGSLGFMADIPISDIYPSLDMLIKGQYDIQERLVIEGKTTGTPQNFAVNEIVIHRARNPCLIELDIFVDEVYLNTFSADGMIISTPSGSTAYSMAAGGPILTPELEALILTPICPHTISNRPIVLMPKKEILVRYVSPYEPIEITYDGFPDQTIATNECLSITPSNKKFKLVVLLQHDCFSTLRSKLGWSKKLKTQTL